MNPVSYPEQAQVFLSQAHDELARGDLRQASEKAWGAAAQAVKAAGEARGWEHDTHGRLFDVVKRLAGETGEVLLPTGFTRANQLHRNFYEGGYSATEVSKRLDAVSEFVSVVGGILRQ